MMFLCMMPLILSTQDPFAQFRAINFSMDCLHVEENGLFDPSEHGISQFEETSYHGSASQMECTTEGAYTWPEGHAIFASGSPFDTLEHNDKVFVPGQANNAYIFPGFGLGVIMSGVSVHDDMLLAAYKYIIFFERDLVHREALLAPLRQVLHYQIAGTLLQRFDIEPMFASSNHVSPTPMLLGVFIPV
ncbi:hypothetical protein V6N13_042284 [Hibiscus sabdariffa]|uniref:Malic enzyme NAD-binding domain-containing protein n=1 Tax=Hibiscus sabdariffa TaxID=183260 RepID=A0ABR2DFL7_9ROSI